MPLSHKMWKKSCKGEYFRHIVFENLKILITQFLPKGEHVESMLIKKANYHALKNIIFNSQRNYSITGWKNKDCLFQKIAAGTNRRQIIAAWTNRRQIIAAGSNRRHQENVEKIKVVEESNSDISCFEIFKNFWRVCRE